MGRPHPVNLEYLLWQHFGAAWLEMDSVTLEKMILILLLKYSGEEQYVHNSEG